MKAGFAMFAVAAGALSLAGAAPALAEKVHYTAELNGASEVPANTTGGKGMVNAELDTTTRSFTYTATYSGLTGPAAAAHFHGPAAAGSNAPPVIMIKNLASPIKGTQVLTPEQMADLQSGKWYFNVHTKANPGGEIRGQLGKP
jgi:hypothetical protein